MPLFGKFSSKKTLPRRNSLTDRDLEEYDFLNEDNSIHLCLDDHELIFEDGQWSTEHEIGTQKKVSNNSIMNQKLKKQIQDLREENNLLKLKFDLLLDMVTEKTLQDAPNLVSHKKKLLR